MDFSLNEEDIPGAKLPKPIIIDECTCGILRRWLLCRGATTSGNSQNYDFGKSIE